ncbi:MAG: DUF971 domain-containing protein [Gammaproteobacteria bacterium]|nr:DUF971 domain-containing protein [Gammaproteobacteria bacterium]
MQPSNITYRKRSKTLVLEYGPSSSELSAELLRVYSPSAEVRGHSPEQKRLQTGKKQVAITGIEPVGNYGIRLTFDDGHDTGIYAWEYLKDLAEHRDLYWQDYLADLKAANASRLPAIPVGHFTPRKT